VQAKDRGEDQTEPLEQAIAPNHVGKDFWHAALVKVPHHPPWEDRVLFLSNKECPLIFSKGYFFD